VRDIFELVESEPGVSTSEKPLTMQLGPDQILVNIDLHLQPELSAHEQMELLERISSRIRKRHPQVVRVSLNPSSWNR